MTQTMSLDELKAQNAAAEQAELEAEAADTEEVENEVDDVEAEEQTSEEDDLQEDEDDDDSDDDSEEDSDGEELEDWMKGSDERAVPLSEHIELRQKLKHQRNDAEERSKALEDELERLRQENEKLKAGGVTQQSEPTPPNLKDFEDDYGDINYQAFNEANAKYTQDLVDYRLESKTSTSSKTQAEEAQTAELESVVNSHYERAEKLVKDGLVSADSYSKADKKIVETLESKLPGKGRLGADYMIQQISKVSDNPEKLWFKLGVDENLLGQVLDDFSKGESEGIIHLMKVDKEISKPKKIRSKAPAPAKEVKGNASVKSSAALAKRYKSAHKKGNSQEAFNIRREAKHNGIDVSNW